MMFLTRTHVHPMQSSRCRAPHRSNGKIGGGLGTDVRRHLQDRVAIGAPVVGVEAVKPNDLCAPRHYQANIVDPETKIGTAAEGETHERPTGRHAGAAAGRSNLHQGALFRAKLASRLPVQVESQPAKDGTGYRSNITPLHICAPRVAPQMPEHTMTISHRYLADRGARLTGCPLPTDKIVGKRAGFVIVDEYSVSADEFPCTLSSQDRAPAAEVSPLRTSAAHFSTTCADVGGQAETAPAVKSPAPAGAVQLSDASAFLLSLIAAHAGRSRSDVLAELIASAGDAIGLSPLLKVAARDIGCIAALPGYAKAAANRFRSGGP